MLGFLGFSQGGCAAVGDWAPCSELPPSPCLACSPLGRGTRSLAEPPGDARSAPELCLIHLVCPNQADTFFPKGFGKHLAKIVSGRGATWEGGTEWWLQRGGVGPASPSGCGGGAEGRWELSF